MNNGWIKMKKWISALLIITIFFGLTGCGSSDKNKAEGDAAELTSEPTVNELESIRNDLADVEWTLDDNGVLTISGNGAMPDYVMRSADNDIEMTVDSPWFDRRLDITSIVIEEGITYAGAWAFSACENLNEISFPDSLIGLGMGCVNGNGLFELVLPDHIKYLGDGVFSGCEKLEKVTIGAGVRSIPYAAFYKCTMLKEVQLSTGLETINEDAFYNCGYLQTINFPEGLKSIGESAFGECWLLRNVDLPESLTNMQSYCFYNSGLEELVLPGSLSVVRDSSFVACPNLKKVTVPTSVKKIEKSAFSSCDGLEEVVYLGTAEDWAAVITESKGNELFLEKLHENLIFDEDGPVSLQLDYRFENEQYGFAANYRIPKLNIQGPDVEHVNQLIHDTLYENAVSCINSIEENGWAHQRAFSCRYSIKDDILSLFIHTHEAETAMEQYFVYNLSLSKGELLTRTDILDAFGLTEEKYQKRVQNGIKDYFDDRNLNLDESLVQQALAEENIDAALMYIGDGGELEVVVKIFVPAGAGYGYIKLVV